MMPELHPLEALLRERIVILDGAMGTMIQQRKLAEEDYRGKRFHDWKGKDLKGSLELLQLTQPHVVEEIHAEYLEAGADVIETNTFSATTIGLQAPAGLPRDIAARLQAAVAKALRERDLAERMANLGMELAENGTEDYARFVREDLERFAAAVKTAGVKHD